MSSFCRSSILHLPLRFCAFCVNVHVMTVPVLPTSHFFWFCFPLSVCMILHLKNIIGDNLVIIIIIIITVRRRCMPLEKIIFYFTFGYMLYIQIVIQWHRSILIGRCELLLSIVLNSTKQPMRETPRVPQSLCVDVMTLSRPSRKQWTTSRMLPTSCLTEQRSIISQSI